MASETFRVLATDSLADLGVLAAGETPDEGDLDFCRRAFNRQLDQYAAERLQIYTVTATTWTIVADGITQSYTVGSGGDINIPRPIYVNHVTFKYTPQSLPIEIPLRSYDDDEWALLTIKTLTSSLPTGFYYNPTYPFATLSLWPIPVSPPGNLTGVLYAPEQIGEILSVNTIISLPPGYRRMIVKNLALEVAPNYQRNVAPELRQAAEESMGVVKQSNSRVPQMDLTGGMGDRLRGAYYIRTGQ